MLCGFAKEYSEIKHNLTSKTDFNFKSLTYFYAIPTQNRGKWNLAIKC